MEKFLSLVARDIYQKYGNDLSQIAIIFPNKRARLFFNQHLITLTDKPIWSPTFLTISELFRSQSALTVPDNIYLVCRLYQIYQQHISTSTDTLDEFYGWGQLILNDFDDLDKGMVNAQQLFSNLEALHDYDNDDFLTTEQREALQHFFNTFQQSNTPLKEQFANLWAHLYAIYTDFNAALLNDGYTYEGALYRQVAEEGLTLDKKQYIFVGFNLLQETEKAIFKQIKDAEKAKFYWDIDLYYLSENPAKQNHEAGKFIRQYLDLFPNELDTFSPELFNNFQQPKQITYVAANTETAQARFATHWLESNQRLAAGNDTAIVICDEQLLPSLLHALPEEATRFNITAGLPLTNMPVTAFIHALYDLRVNGLVSNNRYIKRRYLKHLMAQSCAQMLTEDFAEIGHYLANHYYQVIAVEQLPIADTTKRLLADTTEPHLVHLKRALSELGKKLRESDDMLLKESVFRMFTLVERLEGLRESGLLAVNDATMERLLRSLTSQTTIPLHGEPAIGLQIMGLLETRNLDFSHLLMLSCNEGKMPKSKSMLSIIPYSLRQAFNMTTTDHIDALYSYYFHRLLQRAEDITLLYNQATSDTSKAEMSRYMLQTLIDSPHKIVRQTIVAGQRPNTTLPQAIEKDEMTRAVLDQKGRISPSALGRYLRCPIAFFYEQVADIREPEELDNATDNRHFGNIFHQAAQNLYLQVAQIVGQRTGGLLNAQPLLKQLSVERAVDDALREHNLIPSDGKAAARSTGLNIIGRKVIIEYLRRLLEIDTRLAPTSVKEMERWVERNIRFDTSTGEKIIKLGGIVDRIDQPAHGKGLRVLDYKTGSPANPNFKAVEEIFDSNNIEKHSDYYLQTLLYAVIVANDKQLNPSHQAVAPSLLFIRNLDEKNPEALLKLNGQFLDDVSRVQDEFIHHLKILLGEIFSADNSFIPTEQTARCKKCSFRRLCHL